MASQTELKTRYEFRKKALGKLQEAYLALVDGGVKSYTIDDRTLTRFDLPNLLEEIEKMEKQVDELDAALNNGGKRRKAIGVVPMEW